MTLSVENPTPARRTARRLSSMDASKEMLDNAGPTVVVPPKHLMAPSNAHEVAAAMELARHELAESTTPVTTPGTPPVTEVTDKYAMAFDIVS
jgi:hypothetical protein